MRWLEERLKEIMNTSSAFQSGPKTLAAVLNSVKTLFFRFIVYLAIPYKMGILEHWLQIRKPIFLRFWLPICLCSPRSWKVLDFHLFSPARGLPFLPSSAAVSPLFSLHRCILRLDRCSGTANWPSKNIEILLIQGALLALGEGVKIQNFSGGYIGIWVVKM